MKNGFRTLVPALILVLGASASAWAAEQTKDLKASQAMMDKQTKEMNMDPKKAMEFMKAMLPTDLKLTSLSVDKNKATMMATGKVAGEANKGTIDFEQEDGQWKIVKQSWTNAK